MDQSQHLSTHPALRRHPLRPKGTNRHHHNPIGPAIAISLAADHGALVQGDIGGRENAIMPPLWLDRGGDPLG